MCVKISPPVRNVSRLKVLEPLQRTGLTTRHSPPKKIADLVTLEKLTPLPFTHLIHPILRDVWKGCYVI